MRTKNIDFTEGKLLPSIVTYSIPLILASLIQMLFGAADLAVLGQFDTSADSSAIGAVGATGSIIGLLVSSVVGLSGGTNILLARTVGARDDNRSQRIVGTTVILSASAGVLMLTIGMLTAQWFLNITACPANCYDGALVYLYIYFAATPAIFIYNFGAAIIRVSGDSRSPFIYILISGALNVVLNFVLCVLLSEKVAAVAIATLISNVLGAVLVVLHLLRIKEGPCKVELRNLKFSWRELGNIFLLGIPTAFTSALYSISNLQIQGAINSFGSSASAGNSASAQIEGFVSSITSSIAMTAMVFVGQNVGAKKQERVKLSIVWCLVLADAAALVLGYGALAFGRPLARIFLPNDPLGVEIAMVRLTCLLSIYFVSVSDSIFSFSIRAFGYPILPMINSVVSVILFRVVWMTWIYPVMPTTGDPVKDIFNVYVCYMYSWTLSLIVQALMFAIVYRRYIRGRGKEI